MWLRRPVCVWPGRKLSKARFVVSWLTLFYQLRVDVIWASDLIALTLSVALDNLLFEISTEQSGGMNGRSRDSGRFSLPSISNTLTKHLFSIFAFS